MFQKIFKFHKPERKRERLPQEFVKLCLNSCYKNVQNLVKNDSKKDTIRKGCVRVFRTHNYTALQGSMAKWTFKFKSHVLLLYLSSRHDYYVNSISHFLSTNTTQTGTFSCPLAMDTAGILFWAIYSTNLI